MTTTAKRIAIALVVCSLLLVAGCGDSEPQADRPADDDSNTSSRVDSAPHEMSYFIVTVQGQTYLCLVFWSSGSGTVMKSDAFSGISCEPIDNTGTPTASEPRPSTPTPPTVTNSTTPTQSPTTG